MTEPRFHLRGGIWRYWVAAMGVALVAGVIRPMTLPLAPTAGPTATDASFAAEVGALVRHGGGDATLRMPSDLAEDASGLVYVALRDDGRRVAEAWREDGDPHRALAAALGDARDVLGADVAARVDVVEAVIGRSEHPVEIVDARPRADNAQRGIVGLSMDAPDGQRLHAGPTEMIAENTSFDRVVERWLEDGELHEATIAMADAELFAATQFLVDLTTGQVRRLIRANEVVALASVNRETTEQLADGMAGWLFNQLDVSGQLTYEYWPSRGEASSQNNMIRQWMGTLAMTRVAVGRGDETLQRRAARNVEFNLDDSYSIRDGLGMIADPDGDVKLGAVALAALAISQHPDRARFGEQEAALRRTVDHLWQADGSFRTFLVPADRNDNQNFYPGEALLLWASTLEDEADPDLLRRFMQSFEFYRAWHRQNPNPAFVPWHTMAYERVWRVTRDERLRDFVFEMNDWLVDLQQWDDAPYPDMAGRFYDPDRPDYGPPHASSDGVYMEGLIAAYRLAEAVGDEDRADAYRVALIGGLRHLMQLQFADEVDLFYVSRPERVAGGIRTTEYDNRIRVDNVQHGLMAVLDILERFEPEDYVAESR
jgi:hypothetical protein